MAHKEEKHPENVDCLAFVYFFEVESKMHLPCSAVGESALEALPYCTEEPCFTIGEAKWHYGTVAPVRESVLSESYTEFD